MNILVYEWNTFGQKDLEDNLIQLGCKVDKINYNFENFEEDEAFANKMSDLFLLKRYDFVISFNFFQIISKICSSFCIKYISWVWDSPLINLNSKSIYNPFNYIFIFDGSLYRDMKYGMKADTVYYLPLAVNTDRLDKLIVTEEDKEQYAADVAFVGNLYDKRNHYDEINNLPDYLVGYFDGIMRAQMRIYGYNFIKELLTDDIMSELEKYIAIKPGSNYVGDIRDIFADRFLNAKVTGLERRTLLKSLSQHYDVSLYTNSDTSELTLVNNKGYIDYYEVMPKVFSCSKININMTLRTIKSGIPLRVFDILGAGGFLITNYQEDIATYFEIGEDLVCYESEEDLIAKVGYYLEHEEERLRIARNGYNKVKQHHNYKVRLEEILRIAAEEDAFTSSNLGLGATDWHDTRGIKEKIAELLRNALIEEAKTEYFNYLRSNPGAVRDNEYKDMGMIFRIYAYEKRRGQRALLEYSKELELVLKHFEHIKGLLLSLEEEIGVSLERSLGDSLENRERELVYHVNAKQVSYTALEFIINDYASDKVSLLNQVAVSFMKDGRNDMVIPFLSLAIELKPEDDRTLYNLARALYQLGEYQMAYDYINEITIAPPGAEELMEKILMHI